MMDASFSQTWTARKRLREDQFQPTDPLFDVSMAGQDKSSSHCFSQFADASPLLTRPFHPLPSKLTASKLKHPHKTTSMHNNIQNSNPSFSICKPANRSSPKHKRARPSNSDGHIHPSTSRASPPSSQKMQLSPEFSHSALPFSISKSSPPHTVTVPNTTTIKVNPNHRCHVCNRVHMLGLLNFSSDFINCDVCNKPTCAICVRECVSCDEKICSQCSQEKGDHTFCHACAALNRKWRMIS